MKKTLLFTLILLSQAANALDNNSLLHVGVSSGATIAGYTILSNVLGRSTEVRLPSLVMAGGLTLLAGFSKEVMDTEYTRGKWTHYNTEDMIVNSVSTGVTMLAIYFIDIHNEKKTTRQTAWISGSRVFYSREW